MLVELIGIDEVLPRVMREQFLRNLVDNLFRMTTRSQCFQVLRRLLLPDTEVDIHLFNEGGELRMLIDCRFNRSFRDRKIKVIREASLEKRTVKPPFPVRRTLCPFTGTNLTGTRAVVAAAELAAVAQNQSCPTYCWPLRRARLTVGSRNAFR